MVISSRRSFLEKTFKGSSLLAGWTALDLLDGGELFSQEVKGIGSSNGLAKQAIGKAVAATVHPLATEAALQMMREGGTAIDAIIAAGLTLSVVDGHNSGIGGGCFLLIRSADGSLTAIDGREKAPAAATADMFLRDGKPDTKLSQVGPLACGIPGEIAAFEQAHRRFGKLKWERLFQFAIRAAEEGIGISRGVASAIQSEQASIRLFPSTAQILLDERGNPWKQGDLLRQIDLASTMKKVATHGPEWFYRGDFAKKAAPFLQGLGGIATIQDFANYDAKIREPLLTTYRGNTIVGFPPPSSGGIHVAQMLSMLEAFPLAKFYEEKPVEFYHVLAEAMKLAFADRAHWLGDADFAKVPKGLIDREYAKELAERIKLDRISDVLSHGDPPKAESSFFGDRKHTTHLTAADSFGNWVAMTATVNTSWGNKVIVPGTGVVLNNEMDDFSVAPGIPNAFGLIGAEANAVAGGKRPLSSMSPTIVLGPDRKPRLTCGAAGGPRIINTALQIIIRCLDLGESMDEAIAAVRIHHQWNPDQLSHEPGLPERIQLQLSQIGHSLKSVRSLAVAQGIEQTTQGLLAGSDPRVESLAGAIR